MEKSTKNPPAEFRSLYRGYAVKFCRTDSNMVLAPPPRTSALSTASPTTGSVCSTSSSTIGSPTASRRFNLSSRPRAYTTALGPLDEFAVTGAANGDVSLWDTKKLRTENPLHTFSDHLYHVRSVDWHPKDSSALLSASMDGCVKLWNPDDTNKGCIRTFKDPDIQSSGFYSVQWSPFHEQVFAAGSSLGGSKDALRIFDCRTGSVVSSFFHSHTVLSLGWNHLKQDIMATVAADKRLRVWDTSRTDWGHTLVKMEGFVDLSRAQFVPDHDSVFVTCSGNTVLTGDYLNQAALQTKFDHHTGYVTGFDVSRRVAGLMASTGFDNKVFVWPTKFLAAPERVEVRAVATRSRGSVKWYDDTKGFGFITPYGRRCKDVFVHRSSIKSDGYGTLGEGEVVEFRVTTEGEVLKMESIPMINEGPMSWVQIC